MPPIGEADPGDLAARLGVDFRDPNLLTQALTHASYVHEKSEAGGDYERLEFLGDAVLQLAISHMLLRDNPELGSGELTKFRAGIVNKDTLARLAGDLELGKFIRLSRGETRTLGREKKRLLADVFESVIGAIYLDQGFGAAHDFVKRQFAEVFAGKVERLLVVDYKTRVQEITQERFNTLPDYRHVAAKGPDHDKRFEVELWVGREKYGVGNGRSKKEAEQAAAREAWKAFGLTDPLAHALTRADAGRSS
ncbi:ribonuclease III [bacterium]|nr:ribonuclease III [bacterium]